MREKRLDRNEMILKQDYVEIHARYYPERLNPKDRNLLNEFVTAFMALGDPRFTQNYARVADHPLRAVRKKKVES